MHQWTFFYQAAKYSISFTMNTNIIHANIVEILHRLDIIGRVEENTSYTSLWKEEVTVPGESVFAMFAPTFKEPFITTTMYIGNTASSGEVPANSEYIKNRVLSPNFVSNLSRQTMLQEKK